MSLLASSVQIPRPIGAFYHVWKWQIFNERDQRCADVQRMLSTDPSYDNRTIASTLKMQIWIATNNRDVPRMMKTKFPATVMVYGVVSSEGHIATPHLRSWIESQHQSVPGCAEEWGDPVVQSGGRWLILGVAAGLGGGPQVKRDLWCNCYRRRKWTRRYKFKSWTRLIAFNIALIPFGKVWIQLFSLQLWVNSRID